MEHQLRETIKNRAWREQWEGKGYFDGLAFYSLMFKYTAIGGNDRLESFTNVNINTRLLGIFILIVL